MRALPSDILLYNFCGYTSDDTVVRKFTLYDATESHNTAISNYSTAQKYRTRSKPYMITDLNTLWHIQALTSINIEYRVCIVSTNLNSSGDHHVITNHDETMLRNSHNA